MQRYLRITLATLLFAAMTAVSANAQTIGAEDDTWITGSGTQVDFANFGNVNISQLLGSQPVNSVVSFTGVPLSSSLGTADTLVSRGSATISDSFSATLSIKGLSLGSSPDMTLQDGTRLPRGRLAGEPEWHRPDQFHLDHQRRRDLFIQLYRHADLHLHQR